MDSFCEYIFVYGTLLNGNQNEYARFLEANSILIGSAKVNGKLYKISWYPGAVKTNASEEWVHGHVFQLQNDIQGVLNQLDDYEGIGDSYEPPFEYTREITEVLMDGQYMKSWIYWYCGKVDENQQIKSGNFLNP